ncbi:surface-adhesin E family protein [Burkholderia cenocepacia]|uniref:surface-adhesin E family protein n=1 Tax=Burkholderia cenocepacia TaxID=95486 RepID=UPI00163D1D9A|nr:surface-adhesin E family protein [Burkholderia cenocepacia]
MRTTIAIALLATLSASVFAEQDRWVRLDNGPSDIAYYMDAKTVKVEGDYRKAWFMVSFKRPQKGVQWTQFKPFKSMVAEQYIQCSKHQLAPLRVVYYEGEQASGDSLGTQRYPTQEFEDAIPGSAGEVMITAPCLFQ